MRALRFAVPFIAAVMSAASAIAQTPQTPDAVIAEARAKIAAVAAAVQVAAKTPDEKAVVQAELAFAADAKKRGAQAAFMAAYHPEGKLFPPGKPIAFGIEGAKNTFAGDKSLWEWAPMQVAANGDLATTWGIALISGQGPDGKTYAVTTRYVTVWRKDATGAWKVWLDMGTPGPHPDMR